MNDALERLLQGNRRFFLGQALRSDVSVARRQQIADSPRPFAILLGCSDSRVPPEVIFDCGLGDLFVIRTAGHVMDRVVQESLLFGIRAFGISLVMVLGHARCGAIITAIQQARRLEAEGDTSWIAGQIAPAAEACQHDDDPVRCTIQTHTIRTVAQLKRLVAPVTQGVQILGAYYDLDTGMVEILKT